MEERIRDLFRRYTEGKVTEQESKAVDQVFDQAQQEGLSEQRITGDRLLKLRLDQKIFEQTIDIDMQHGDKLAGNNKYG